MLLHRSPCRCKDGAVHYSSSSLLVTFMQQIKLLSAAFYVLLSASLFPPSLPHLPFRFTSSAGEGSCLIRRLVAISFSFFFSNTFVHGRWFSVYSSCGVEQMDTGWHLRITPRNDDLLQSPCPSFFWCGHKPPSVLGPDQLLLLCTQTHRSLPSLQSLRLMARPVREGEKTQINEQNVTFG